MVLNYVLESSTPISYIRGQHRVKHFHARVGKDRCTILSCDSNSERS
jgi:hypothetical protein